VWVFNLEGSVDLAIAITLATVFDASPYMGPAYWIPAFWVPALLVTHYLTFVVLLESRWAPERGDRSGCSGRGAFFWSDVEKRAPAPTHS
jgi:hypothetical protein